MDYCLPQDECSFVSLRDVERTMTVMTWFYRHREYLRPQAPRQGDIGSDDNDSDAEMSDEDVDTQVKCRTYN